MLVRIPVEVVKDWNIKAEDQIETDISWVGSDISVKISKNGEAVTGKIINVRMNVNVRINNIHPYKADCEVINPFDGQRYLYSSGNITYDIRNFAGEDVTVYIDRKNPKNYYVDVEGLIEKKTAVSGNDYIDYRK